MCFVAAFFRRQTPAFVSVVHESAAEVVGVDDKNQDKSGDASDNGDEVQEQAKCGQYELLGRVANRDADGSPDVF